MTKKTLFSTLALSVLVFSSSSIWASSPAVDEAGQPKAPPSSPAAAPEARVMSEAEMGDLFAIEAAPQVNGPATKEESEQTEVGMEEQRMASERFAEIAAAEDEEADRLDMKKRLAWKAALDEAKKR